MSSCLFVFIGGSSSLTNGCSFARSSFLRGRPRRPGFVGAGLGAGDSRPPMAVESLTRGPPSGPSAFRPAAPHARSGRSLNSAKGREKVASLGTPPAASQPHSRRRVGSCPQPLHQPPGGGHVQHRFRQKGPRQSRTILQRLALKQMRVIHKGQKELSTKGHEVGWICCIGTSRGRQPGVCPPPTSALAFRLGVCDSPLRGKSDGSRTPWERGRPARTRLGTCQALSPRRLQQGWETAISAPAGIWGTGCASRTRRHDGREASTAFPRPCW